MFCDEQMDVASLNFILPSFYQMNFSLLLALLGCWAYSNKFSTSGFLGQFSTSVEWARYELAHAFGLSDLYKNILDVNEGCSLSALHNDNHISVL